MKRPVALSHNGPTVVLSGSVIHPKRTTTQVVVVGLDCMTPTTGLLPKLFATTSTKEFVDVLIRTKSSTAADARQLKVFDCTISPEVELAGACTTKNGIGASYLIEIPDFVVNRKMMFTTVNTAASDSVVTKGWIAGMNAPMDIKRFAHRVFDCQGFLASPAGYNSVMLASIL